MQLNSRIIKLVKGTWKFCYIRYFLLKQYFCAMLCLYAFKLLVGENEIDYHLSAQNKIGNIAYLNI